MVIFAPARRIAFSRLKQNLHCRIQQMLAPMRKRFVIVVGTPESAAAFAVSSSKRVIMKMLLKPTLRLILQILFRVQIRGEVANAFAGALADRGQPRIFSRWHVAGAVSANQSGISWCIPALVQHWLFGQAVMSIIWRWINPARWRSSRWSNWSEAGRPVAIFQMNGLP